jgi:hypothetical protein
MAANKPFKVASISSNPNSFGLYGHIMIAEDGETWQVGRVRSGGLPVRWERGQIIDVPLMMDPLRGVPRPSWEELHCEIPQLLPDAPDDVLAEVWGKAVAVDRPSAPQQEVTPSIVFTADQFVAGQRHSAQEKADFANAFVRFVENGFQEAHFTEGFYLRLSNTFGHIAHFNQKTFYRTCFGKARDRALFLRKTVDHEPVGNPG